MNKQIRQCAPDGQVMSGGETDNSEAVDSPVSGGQRTRDVNTNSSDEANESGTVSNSDEDESGVDRREKHNGSLVGTNNDKTGPDENMATES